MVLDCSSKGSTNRSEERNTINSWASRLKVGVSCT